MILFKILKYQNKYSLINLEILWYPLISYYYPVISSWGWLGYYFYMNEIWMWEDWLRLKILSWLWDEWEMTWRWLVDDKKMTERRLWGNRLKLKNVYLFVILLTVLSVTVRCLWDKFNMPERWLWDDWLNQGPLKIKDWLTYCNIANC